MSSHTRSRLSLGELSSLIASLPVIASSILAFFVTSSFLQWKDGARLGSRALRRNAAASICTVISVLSPRQVRALIPHTTGDCIHEYCSAHQLAHHSVLVPNESGFPPARLHFINCKLDERGPILLYFHGGGFIVPLKSPAYAISLAHSAHANLVLLEYTLAPECVYPGQLAQSLAALRLLLLHRPPSDIIIAGESAGGNLVLAIMAHLQQPKASLPQLLCRPSSSSSLANQQQQNFRAVLAISPRTANCPSAESFRYNAGKDFMSRRSLGAITRSWKPEAEVWAAPVLARPGFWDGIRADMTLLVVGGNEVYRDDVCTVAKVMGASKVDCSSGSSSLDGGKLADVEMGYDAAVQLLVCPGEMHCQSSMDFNLGIHDGYMARGVAGWLSRV